MKKILYIAAILAAIAVASVLAVQVRAAGDGTITQLQLFHLDSSGNVTQTTANKPLKLSGPTPGGCLTLTSGNIATTTGSPCGGSGSTPGGSAGNIQYNASGSFGGAATTTLTAGSGISLSGVPIIIGSTPISITNTAGGFGYLFPGNATTTNITFTNGLTGALTGNASTATALAANGTNCSAGNYALGVDASGNAEGCTVATTGTVTSIATNNGLTGGTITGSGTIGLAPIAAGVLGAVTGSTVPTSQATSTLYGTAPAGGYVLGWNNSTNGIGWIATSSSGGGSVTAVSIATANGFAGSSSGGATPALTLTTTITGLLKGNGTAISAAALSDFPAQAANTVIANGTSASAVPTAVATSTFFGTGTGGQVLAWNNGVPQWVATTTFNSPLSFASGAVSLNTSGAWSGNAGTATALAANGTNCSAGNYPLGVDASGNAEGCTLASTGTVTGVTALYPILSTGGTAPIISTAFGTTTNNGMTQGNLYVGSGGIFLTAASSSIFGYVPLNPTRQLTIAGTANQITSSAGAQDLSADRTWTLSIPSQFNIQQASTTQLSAGLATFGQTASSTFASDGSLTSPKATITAASTTNLTFSQSFGSGSSKIPSEFYGTFSAATTTAWTGTSTTISLGIASVNETWDSIQCTTDAGTLNIQFNNGGSALNMVMASTTVGTQAFTTNNAFSAGAKRTVTFGTPASSPTYAGCTVAKHYTF